MGKELGDDYVRRFATFLRAQEQRLAGLPNTKSGSNAGSFSNVLGWIGIDFSTTSPPRIQPPTVLSMDLHHLFYLFMRFEALDINVGSLDTKIQYSSPSVISLALLAAKDRSDTRSVSSFASTFSAVSKLSLGAPWWSSPPPNLNNEVKYIYSAFTKLPALSIRQNDLNFVTELMDDPPIDNAVPLDSFKSLQTLELLDIDPRALLGWDLLAESLRSLTIKRSGVEDMADILVDAVLDDELRRRGQGPSTIGRRHSRSIRFASNRSNRRGLLSGVPSPVAEESSEDVDGIEPTSPIPRELSNNKWRVLRHLSLADNALTFVPSSPLRFLTSLTHLDLSSNLLISVPPGLSVLHNLVSLNLSDNMIDSVLGIYTVLGQVLTLNLSKNRLDSLCGLERLMALERVDLRDNKLEDTGEVGRLAILPNISEVWVKGNTFIQTDEEYRVRCFEFFAQENKSVQLDGSAPSFLEARSMRKTVPAAAMEDLVNSRRDSSAPSPPVVAVGSPHSQSHSSRWKSLDPSFTHILQASTGTSTSRPSTPELNVNAGLDTFASPSSGVSVPASAGSTKPLKKRKPKRIVDLDAASVPAPNSELATPSGSHQDPTISRPEPDVLSKSRHIKGASDGAVTANLFLVPPSTTLPPNGTGLGSDRVVESLSKSPPAIRPKGSRRSAHARYATEGHLGSPSGERSRRQSASVYEPAETFDEAGGGGGGATNHADAYRARIEALRSEVGDSWLKVLSQSGGFVGNRPPDAKMEVDLRGDMR
ncbi:hypothetical protein BS47DRAFT_224268 [Hydnum rufescens UP504]|uniref:Uncharacterized protein n=1 Tax=Hydnum rufescens UP504 TaxID=1448309 RepID=A0A9P6B7G4_9AGAM|nr:hypothetical protein BS47DRAFT_224268 [Hydnum rufescens UP504]